MMVMCMIIIMNMNMFIFKIPGCQSSSEWHRQNKSDTSHYDTQHLSGNYLLIYQDRNWWLRIRKK